MLWIHRHYACVNRGGMVNLYLNSSSKTKTQRGVCVTPSYFIRAVYCYGGSTSFNTRVIGSRSDSA